MPIMVNAQVVQDLTLQQKYLLPIRTEDGSGRFSLEPDRKEGNKWCPMYLLLVLEDLLWYPDERECT